MYKYQEETFEYLKELCERLEKLTEDKISLKIGFGRGEFINSQGTGYYTDSGDLMLSINYDDYFSIITDIDRKWFSYPSDDMYFKLDNNLFLKLNEWIGKIYKNKKDREEFYEKLNKELLAINNSL